MVSADRVVNISPPSSSSWLDEDEITASWFSVGAAAVSLPSWDEGGATVVVRLPITTSGADAARMEAEAMATLRLLTLPMAYYNKFEWYLLRSSFFL